VEIGDSAGLFVGGVVGADGHGDVVDDEAVVGVGGGEGAEIRFQGIEVVFIAGIVDEPEVGDDIAEDAATAIAVDDVVDDEGGRSIGSGGVIGAGTEVEDDAVAIGMIGGAVEFTDDDIVGDDVVEAGVVVEPLVGVERDAAGPAVPLRDGGGRGEIAVVEDEVVIGGEVIAVASGDAGAAGIVQGVGDEAEVMSTAAPESVAGVALAVQVEAAEFEVSRSAGGEGAAVGDAEDGSGIGGAGIDEVDGGGIVVFINDPGRGGTAVGRGEGGREVIGTAEEAEDGAGESSVGGAEEGFGGRGGGAGVGVVTGGGSEEGAVGGRGGVVDGDVHERTGGGHSGRIVDFGDQGMSAVGERSGIESEGPVVGTGSIGIAPTIDGDLHGADAHRIGGQAGNRDGPGDGSAAGRAADGHRGCSCGHNIDAEISGGGLSGRIFHLHGEGKGTSDRRRAGDGTCGIHSQAVRQCAD